MCKLCDKIQAEASLNYTNHMENIWIEILKDEFLLCFSNGVYVLTHPISFCPFCGKKLVIKSEPISLDNITSIFDYLRLLSTFTERSGPEYEKWRYASDYAMKHCNDMSCQEMIKHIEKKFKEK